LSAIQFRCVARRNFGGHGSPFKYRSHSVARGCAILGFALGTSPERNVRLPRVTAATKVFGNVLLFLRRKPEAEARVVVIHDIGQCCETTIMIEAALLMRPKSRQRRGAVAVGRGAIGLKSVNANFRCRVQIVSGLGEKRSHMA